MDSGRNSNDLVEVLFSGIAEDKFIQKITESVQYQHHSITSSPDIPSSISLERSKSKEAEIGIFEAQKYCNVRLDNGPITVDTATAHGYRKPNQVELLHAKTKSKPGTAGVISEANLNGQTAPLPSYQTSLPRAQSKPKRVHGKSGFLAGLSCHGSCSGKKSVYVSSSVEHVVAIQGREHRKEATQIVHSPIMLNGIKLQPRLKVKDEFHKPVQNLAIKRQLEKKKTIEESQKSLEVFGSHKLNKEVIEMSLERKLSLSSCDATPKNPKLPTSSMRSQEYEDIESDDSSDLFELENIPGSGQAFFTRGTSDGVSGCMCQTPYAPSETSLEQSVVRASAADFSAISDYDETMLSENFRTTSGASKVATEIEAKTGCSIKLLDCKSHKAVSCLRRLQN